MRENSIREFMVRASYLESLPANLKYCKVYGIFLFNILKFKKADIVPERKQEQSLNDIKSNELKPVNCHNII